MDYKELLSEYLERAEKLLQYDDIVNFTYCALELRKAIEMIVWKQFSDVFSEPLSRNGMYIIDFILKLQSKSIRKMYELLKKHVKDYVEGAERGRIISISSASGDAPLRENGKICFIPTSLPTSDYDYLSQIIHYQKQIDDDKYKPEKSKLNPFMIN